MSANRNALEHNDTTQDPDAILTIHSSGTTGVVPDDSTSSDSPAIQTLGATSKHQLNYAQTAGIELPTVIINGKPVTIDNSNTEGEALFRSKYHACSEPDPSQVELYKKPPKPSGANNHESSRDKELRKQGTYTVYGHALKLLLYKYV